MKVQEVTFDSAISDLELSKDKKTILVANNKTVSIYDAERLVVLFDFRLYTTSCSPRNIFVSMRFCCFT